MKKIQLRLVAAVEARGYKRHENPRSYRKYMEFASPSNAAKSLTVGDHRLLIGKGGALRMTRSTIANSIPIHDIWKKRLLDEYEDITGQ